jgi:hypothetical protein
MFSIQRRCFLNIAAAALFVGVPALCFAQNQGPAWIRFQITRVKPDRVTEYEGYVKQVAAAYKKAGALAFIVYQNYSGDLTEYTSILPLKNFAEMDDPNPLAKVLGEEGFANLQRGVRSCTTSQVRYFSQAQNDLMINKGQPTTLAVQTRTVVTNGKMDEYLAWMKSDLKPAMEKAGVMQYRVARPIFGAPSTSMVETVRFVKDFAEIDGGPILNQKLGADAVRAMNAKVSGIVQSNRVTLIRIRPDLSYLPAPTGTN